MDAFTYKGITDGKYVEGDIEALNDTEAAHKLKDQKIINVTKSTNFTNLKKMETELGWVAAFMTKHLNLLQQKRKINSN